MAASKTKVGIVAGGTVLAGAALLQQLATPSCPSTDVCLSWTPPTKFTDGTAIPSGTAITYKVYRDGGSSSIAVVTASSTRIPNEPRGTHQYVVTATVGAAESENSSAVSKTIRFAGPSNGSLERPTDGAIEPSH